MEESKSGHAEPVDHAGVVDTVDVDVDGALGLDTDGALHTVQMASDPRRWLAVALGLTRSPSESTMLREFGAVVLQDLREIAGIVVGPHLVVPNKFRGDVGKAFGVTLSKVRHRHAEIGLTNPPPKKKHTHTPLR